MKILYKYLRKYWKLLALTLVLATINQVFSLLDPLIFRFIVDNYATKFSEYTTEDFLRGVLLLLAGAWGVAMVSRIAKNFQDYYVNVITKRLGARMYTDGIKHSLLLPYEKFEDQRSGETLQMIQKVREDVENLIALFVNTLFTAVVGIIFVTIYSFTVHWIIAPVYFAVIPILGIISYILSNKIKKVQESIVKKTNDLAGSTTESLRNVELVKSLGLSGQEISRLNKTTNKILNLDIDKVKYIRRLSFIQGTTVNLLRNGIILLMLYLIFTQNISVGEFISLFIYSFFIFSPLQQMGTIINTYRETEVSLKNFQGIMKSSIEKVPKNSIKTNAIDSIKFNNVNFQHKSGNKPAVNDLSFTIDKGQTIAFVGPSGSGKTTLVKLLVGLYQPKAGDILYNQVSYNKINRNNLRKQIGLVTQDTQLFSGSIRDNLLFVNPKATDQEIQAALNQSAAQSLLERADKGLGTVIGEGGIKVSGGERQRLSIARALLRKPNLLVFDEATSALDSITEQEISKTIRDISMQKKQITIMIAHRLSTIMHADRIYVLEKGSIVEHGGHDELLSSKGLYYAMWRQQVGEGIEEE